VSLPPTSSFDSRGGAALASRAELRLLSIHGGNLDDQARSQSRSHVSHTYDFYARFPWTKEIKTFAAICQRITKSSTAPAIRIFIRAGRFRFSQDDDDLGYLCGAVRNDRRNKKRCGELPLDMRFDKPTWVVDGRALESFQEAEVFRLTSSSPPT